MSGHSVNSHVLEHSLDPGQRYDFEERVAIILADAKDPKDFGAEMEARKVAWKQVREEKR